MSMSASAFDILMSLIWLWLHFGLGRQLWFAFLGFHEYFGRQLALNLRFGLINISTLSLLFDRNNISTIRPLIWLICLNEEFPAEGTVLCVATYGTLHRSKSQKTCMCVSVNPTLVESAFF